MPFNEVNGERILADQAISTDKTYKVTGQFDYDGMDYSYYDIEGLNSYEKNRYEFQSKIDSLIIGIKGTGLNIAILVTLLSSVHFILDNLTMNGETNIIVNYGGD